MRVRDHSLDHPTGLGALVDEHCTDPTRHHQGWQTPLVPVATRRAERGDVCRRRINAACVDRNRIRMHAMHPGNCAARSDARRHRPCAGHGRKTLWAAGVSRPTAIENAPGRTVHRYYDPTTGEFLTVDPDVSETQQPYYYAGDDPTNETDPSGDAATCNHDPLTWLNCIKDTVAPNSSEFHKIAINAAVLQVTFDGIEFASTAFDALTAGEGFAVFGAAAALANEAAGIAGGVATAADCLSKFTLVNCAFSASLFLFSEGQASGPFGDAFLGIVLPAIKSAYDRFVNAIGPPPFLMEYFQKQISALHDIGENLPVYFRPAFDVSIDVLRGELLTHQQDIYQANLLMVDLLKSCS